MSRRLPVLLAASVVALALSGCTSVKRQKVPGYGSTGSHLTLVYAQPEPFPMTWRPTKGAIDPRDTKERARRAVAALVAALQRAVPPLAAEDGLVVDMVVVPAEAVGLNFVDLPNAPEPGTRLLVVRPLAGRMSCTSGDPEPECTATVTHEARLLNGRTNTTGWRAVGAIQVNGTPEDDDASIQYFWQGVVDRMDKDNLLARPVPPDEREPGTTPEGDADWKEDRLR